MYFLLNLDWDLLSDLFHTPITMKINTRVRYGLRTMIEIAKANGTSGVLQKDIASNQNISVKYLDNIIAALKVAGLITTVKGKGSGYRLTKNSGEITFLEIYTAFEPVIIVDCLNNDILCKKSCGCVARDFWDEFRHEIEHIMINKTLDQIINWPQKINSILSGRALSNVNES